MNVKKLKKLLEKLPDDTIVVTSSSDHSYRHVGADYTDAEQQNNGDFSEYHGDKHMFPGSKKIKVLVIT